MAGLPYPPPLNDAKKKHIKATIPVLEQHGLEITTVFYAKLLEEHSVLKNFFNHSKQQVRITLCVTSVLRVGSLNILGQRGDQAQALARAVLAYATNIDDLSPILPVVERVCNKHASLGVRPEMYDIVGKYLLGAIKDVVGAEVFSGDLYDAWVDAYWNLANLFIDKEQKLYKAAAWEGWKQFTVVSKVSESSDVTSLWLRPKDGRPLPSFKPGQYVSVQKYVEALG